MSTLRDHVEELVVNSLIKQYPDDLPDRDIEVQFKQLSPVLDVVMGKVLATTTIPYFTNDDLISFMYLKTHQILRRQRWDTTKNPYSFFYVAFKHLMRDIIRRCNSQRAQKMDRDVLDMLGTGFVVVEFWEWNNSNALEEESEYAY